MSRSGGLSIQKAITLREAQQELFLKRIRQWYGEEQ